MANRKYRSLLGTLSVALCVALTPFSFVTPQLKAQAQSVTIRFPRTAVGAPRRAIGGGTRGPVQVEAPSCVATGSYLTVLSPQNNVVTTVSAEPTLFWYIPKTQAKFADFIVYDEQGQAVYQTALALKGIPGVVQLSLPRTVGLEIGQEYDWKLVLRCNSENEEENLAVGGTIKRTVLTSRQKAQLAEAKQPLKQAEVYAEAGVWQETISIIAQLRHDRPRDRSIDVAWKELLESVDLRDIVNQPLVECCRADN